MGRSKLAAASNSITNRTCRLQAAANNRSMGRYGGAFAARPEGDTSAEAKEQRVRALFPAEALPATTLIVPETQTRDRHQPLSDSEFEII